MWFYCIGFSLAGVVLGFIAGCYWIDYKNKGRLKRRCANCKKCYYVRGVEVYCTAFNGKGQLIYMPDECGKYVSNWNSKEDNDEL